MFSSISLFCFKLLILKFSVFILFFSTSTLFFLKIFGISCLLLKILSLLLKVLSVLLKILGIIISVSFRKLLSTLFVFLSKILGIENGDFSRWLSTSSESELKSLFLTFVFSSFPTKLLVFSLGILNLEFCGIKLTSYLTLKDERQRMNMKEERKKIISK